MYPTLLPRAREGWSLYLFVGVLFAVGVLFGCLVVSALSLEQQQNLADQMSSFVQSISAGVFPDRAETFWNSLWMHGKWLLLIWLLGMSVVGLPFVLALDFLKGVLVGFAIGSLIAQHAWKGLLFALLSVAPPNLFAVPAFLVTSVSAFLFARFVIKNRLLRRSGRIGPPLFAFVSTTAVMFLALVAASFIGAYCSPALIQWASPLVMP